MKLKDDRVVSVSCLEVSPHMGVKVVCTVAEPELKPLRQVPAPSLFRIPSGLLAKYSAAPFHC